MTGHTRKACKFSIHGGELIRGSAQAPEFAITGCSTSGPKLRTKTRTVLAFEHVGEGLFVLKPGVKSRVRDAAQRLLGSWYDRCNNENIVISSALAANPSQAPISYPSLYAGFLRDCTRPQRHRLREIKSLRPSSTQAASRFATLLDVLSSDVPPLPMSAALEIGRVADVLLGNTEMFAYGKWIGDVGLHCGRSSSFGRAGRLISSIVRFMKSQQCLELGTAYGMSALFTLAALDRNGQQGHLTTLEGSEPQFSLASEMLQSKFPGQVSCCKGLTSEALPGLIPTLGAIDFLFHDAGHSREDYVSDFRLVESALASGSAVLLDDINWTNPRYYKGEPESYAGWRAIVDNERVERAVEVDAKMGLVLLR